MGRPSKRTKEDSNASTNDTLNGQSKKDVLLQGSGEGNESEALKMREIMGIRPKVSEGTLLAGAREPTQFSFGFVMDNGENNFSDHAVCESIPDDTTDLKYERVQGHAENSLEKRRVLVGGMPYSLTPDQVREFWSECGQVVAVDCFTFSDTKKFRGMACVAFATEEAYGAALACDGEYADGFQLKVEPWVEARKRPQRPEISLQTSRELALGKKIDGYNVAFVCNLPYELTADDVKDLFVGCSVDFVRLHTKEGSNESRGFAHVHFRNGSDLETALTFDGMNVRGRVVRVGYAKQPDDVSHLSKDNTDPGLSTEHERNPDHKKDGVPPGRKHPKVDGVLVSNLPFKASEGDIEEFFKGCNIEKVILPMKKGDSGNLGVCIVSFKHPDSCDFAVKLNGTRFYGRHVGIKYAKPRDVSRLRIMASRTIANHISESSTKEDRSQLGDMVNQEIDTDDDPLMSLL